MIKNTKSVNEPMLTVYNFMHKKDFRNRWEIKGKCVSEWEGKFYNRKRCFIEILLITL